MGWTGCLFAQQLPWVLASMDRNGLRPLRYSITSDDLFCWIRNWYDKIPEEKLLKRANWDQDR